MADTMSSWFHALPQTKCICMMCCCKQWMAAHAKVGDLVVNVLATELLLTASPAACEVCPVEACWPFTAATSTNGNCETSGKAHSPSKE
jgi:hypothetical protein